MVRRHSGLLAATKMDAPGRNVRIATAPDRQVDRQVRSPVHRRRDHPRQPTPTPRRDAPHGDDDSLRLDQLRALRDGHPPAARVRLRLSRAGCPLRGRALHEVARLRGSSHLRVLTIKRGCRCNRCVALSTQSRANVMATGGGGPRRGTVLATRSAPNRQVG